MPSMHRTSLLLAAAVAAMPFSAFAYSDVPQHVWYAEAVASLSADGLLDTSQSLFRPGDTATRAELIKLIVEMNGGVEGNMPSLSSFDDVATDAWFFRYMEKAGMELWVTGDGDCVGRHPCFARPTANVSRAEAAALIARSFGLEVGAPIPFTDVPNDAWYAEAINAAAHACALQGDDMTGRVRPADPLNRAELVAMLFRVNQHRLYGVECATPDQQQSSVASSKATSSKAASQAAAGGMLAISAGWQTSWQLVEVEGSAESYANVQVMEEAGEPSPFFRIAFPQSSGTRHNWEHFGKPLSGVVVLADTGMPAAKNMWFRQYVRFPVGFDFHKGGGLPGIVTGLDHDRTEEEMGAVWLSWEKDGKIAIGGRFSDKDQRVDNYLPGADNFAADGQWHRIDLHVTLNTEASRPNGVIEAWYDGEKVASAESVLFPTKAGDAWDGLLFDVHFGTMDLSSVSPKAQHVDLGGLRFSEKKMAD